MPTKTLFHSIIAQTPNWSDIRLIWGQETYRFGAINNSESISLVTTIEYKSIPFDNDFCIFWRDKPKGLFILSQIEFTKQLLCCNNLLRYPRIRNVLFHLIDVNYFRRNFTAQYKSFTRQNSQQLSVQLSVEWQATIKLHKLSNTMLNYHR